MSASWGPKGHQETPKGLQRSPKRPQEAPRRCQEAAKTAPRGRQEEPRGSQEEPTGHQYNPKGNNRREERREELPPDWWPCFETHRPSVTQMGRRDTRSAYNSVQGEGPLRQCHINGSASRSWTVCHIKDQSTAPALSEGVTWKGIL